MQNRTSVVTSLWFEKEHLGKLFYWHIESRYPSIHEKKQMPKPSSLEGNTSSGSLSSAQVFGVRWMCEDIFKLWDSVSSKEPNSRGFLPVSRRHVSIHVWMRSMFPWPLAHSPPWLCQRWGCVGRHSSLWQTSGTQHVWLRQPPKVKIILIKS